MDFDRRLRDFEKQILNGDGQLIIPYISIYRRIHGIQETDFTDFQWYKVSSKPTIYNTLSPKVIRFDFDCKKNKNRRSWVNSSHSQTFYLDGSIEEKQKGKNKCCHPLMRDGEYNTSLIIPYFLYRFQKRIMKLNSRAEGHRKERELLCRELNIDQVTKKEFKKYENKVKGGPIPKGHFLRRPALSDNTKGELAKLSRSPFQALQLNIAYKNKDIKISVLACYGMDGRQYIHLGEFCWDQEDFTYVKNDPWDRRRKYIPEETFGEIVEHLKKRNDIKRLLKNAFIQRNMALFKSVLFTKDEELEKIGTKFLKSLKFLEDLVKENS